MSPRSLHILALLVLVSKPVFSQTFFEKAMAIFDGGSQIELTEVSTSRILPGTLIYSVDPDVEKEAIALLYNDGSKTYFNQYLKTSLTASWNLNTFIQTFEKSKAFYSGLSVDSQSSSLLQTYKGAKAVIEARLRKNVSEGKNILAEQHLCVAVNGCDLPIQGTQFQHFNQGEVTSYSYYQLQ